MKYFYFEYHAREKSYNYYVVKIVNNIGKINIYF